MKHQSKLENYLYRMATGVQRGWTVVPVLALLTLLEGIYRVLLKCRYASAARRKLPVPVISIGNLMIGGTGKTPMTVAVAKLLQQEGLRPAILTRGYGGSAQKQGLIFHDGDLTRLGPEVTGDEPYLMARLLPGVFFGVGRDRYQMAQELLIRYPEIDLFLLDDGFQHWNVWRDLDVVLVDGVNPFGNGHLIPRGLLREPLSALKRAGMVFVTRGEQISDEAREDIITRIRRFNQTVPVALAATDNRRFTPLTPEMAKPDRLNEEKNAIVTAIGNPEQFRTAVLKSGVMVEAFQVFPDHHYWTAEEIAVIIGKFKAQGIHHIITTAKDGVKLERFSRQFQTAGIGCYILNLEFWIMDSQLQEKLKMIAMKKGD